MPRDPIARQDAQAWVAKAELDLRAAKLDLSVDPPLLADAAFHCQQAAEKSLKGILALHDRPFRKTHDIGELAGVAIQVEDAIAQSALAARQLTKYSWAFRYPGDVDEPPAADVDDALARATALVTAARAVVEAE